MLVPLPTCAGSPLRPSLREPWQPPPPLPPGTSSRQRPLAGGWLSPPSAWCMVRRALHHAALLMSLPPLPAVRV
jgi:hypothetical protein